jgi:hypothetical protein
MIYKITEDDEVFVVDPKVKRIRIKNREQVDPVISLEPNIVYS